MTRFAIVLALFVAACDVGSALPNGQTPDGGSGMKMDGSGSSALPPHDHLAPLDPMNPTNAGQGCLSANCHLTGNTGTNAPAFGFAGTVFTGPAGSVPLANVTVTVGGVTATSDMAGNFYSYTAVSYTSPQNATANSSAMGATISTGDCNSNQCHQFPGGMTSPIYTQ